MKKSGHVNPLTPKSVVLRKVTLHGQCLVNVYQIWTAKRSSTDPSFESIKLYSSPMWHLINHPYKLCNFFFLEFKVKLISDNNPRIKSCILSYSSGVYLIYTRSEIILNVFLLSLWMLLNSSWGLLYDCSCNAWYPTNNIFQMISLCVVLESTCMVTIFQNAVFPQEWKS